ncbi:hypothetical protein HYY72_03345 [Candidatus Woesearchaeota archaeon]|nr:hypothetical protein [Candidatus Woesearchaeota archaeon]
MSTPVFVKVERYKKVQTAIDRVKKRLEDAKIVFKRINELKTEEEHELGAWQSELARIENKISNIQSALSKPR